MLNMSHLLKLNAAWGNTLYYTVIIKGGKGSLNFLIRYRLKAFSIKFLLLARFSFNGNDEPYSEQAAKYHQYTMKLHDISWLKAHKSKFQNVFYEKPGDSIRNQFFSSCLQDQTKRDQTICYQRLTKIPFPHCTIWYTNSIVNQRSEVHSNSRCVNHN
jgi:hypothetical protein